MKGVILLPLFVLISCGHVRTDGGQASFEPAVYSTLSPADHATYAQTVVKREERDPDGMPLKQIVTSPKGALKKMAIVLFETQFQPSRTGLAATGRNAYLSVRGKQILTERAFRQWARALEGASGVTWVKRQDLEKSAAFRAYGSVVPDHILHKNATLTDEDVFWKNGGQEIPMTTLMLPRNQQDVSVLFIPATEMMIMPKMVAHQNHWVNDICKELGVDGVVLVSSVVSWSAGGVDKRTKEIIPEEMKFSLDASILYPFSTYHAAAKDKRAELAKKSVPLAVYSVKANVPVTITLPEDQQTFESIQKHILTPFETHYAALTGLMVDRMVTDIQQTHQN